MHGVVWLECRTYSLPSYSTSSGNNMSKETEFAISPMYIHPGQIEILSALFSNRPSVELLETNSIPDGVSLHSRGVEA